MFDAREVAFSFDSGEWPRISLGGIASPTRCPDSGTPTTGMSALRREIVENRRHALHGPAAAGPCSGALLVGGPDPGEFEPEMQPGVAACAHGMQSGKVSLAGRPVIFGVVHGADGLAAHLARTWRWDRASQAGGPVLVGSALAGGSRPLLVGTAHGYKRFIVPLTVFRSVEHPSHRKPLPFAAVCAGGRGASRALGCWCGAGLSFSTVPITRGCSTWDSFSTDPQRCTPYYWRFTYRGNYRVIKERAHPKSRRFR